MHKTYPITLTDAERDQLQQLIAAGTAPARLLTHARILLKADQGPAGPGWVDVRIADAVEVSQPTVARVRRQYVEDGLASALNRRVPTRDYRRKLDGAQEARLVTLACSEPPAGHARWSLRLLADRLVELDVVDRISHQTVHRVLKKRPQAVADQAVVYPAAGQCRVRLAHGGRARCLYPTLRLAATGGLLG